MPDDDNPINEDAIQLWRNGRPGWHEHPKPVFMADPETLEELYWEYRDAEGWDKREVLYRYYDLVAPQIMKIAAEEGPYTRGCEKYGLPWVQTFSHAEKFAWEKLHNHPSVMLYPEYPVGKFFLDFGNPALSIGVEIDGKNYHDKDYDFARDLALLRQGWIIFRVPAKELFWDLEHPADYVTRNGGSIEHDWNDPEVHEVAINYYLRSGDGFLESLENIIYRRAKPTVFGREWWWASLESHLSLRMELDQTPQCSGLQTIYSGANWAETDFWERSIRDDEYSGNVISWVGRKRLTDKAD